MPHPLILITAGIAFAILVLLDVMRSQRDQRRLHQPVDFNDPYLAAEVRRALHPEAHDHAPHRDSERHRGGRVNQHADGVNL